MSAVLIDHPALLQRLPDKVLSKAWFASVLRADLWTLTDALQAESQRRREGGVAQRPIDVDLGCDLANSALARAARWRERLDQPGRRPASLCIWGGDGLRLSVNCTGMHLVSRRSGALEGYWEIGDASLRVRDNSATLSLGPIALRLPRGLALALAAYGVPHTDMAKLNALLERLARLVGADG